jgi:hypothetical protein
MSPRLTARQQRIRVLGPPVLVATGMLAVLGASLISPPVGSAQDQGIIADDRAYGPDAPASRWNGMKVYLSSPRHEDSRHRGECGLPDRGWEENVNGREWNRRAAYGRYFEDVYSPQSGGRSFRARGYRVTVSSNSRTLNGFLQNRTRSNNWNANVHIVSHTNAAGGRCQSAQYTLGIWRLGDSRGESLARRLSYHVGQVAPGPVNNWCSGGGCPNGGLAELGANARWRAYVELVFHTNQNSQSWMHGAGTAVPGVERYSWRYGRAVDLQLGSPR